MDDDKEVLEAEVAEPEQEDVASSTSQGDQVPLSENAPTPKEPGSSYGETNESAPSPGLPHDGGTAAALFGILKLSPFTDLHQKIGGDQRVEWREHLCFALDAVVRAIAILLLLALITAVAIKTIYPIPIRNLFQSGYSNPPTTVVTVLTG